MWIFLKAIRCSYVKNSRTENTESDRVIHYKIVKEERPARVGAHCIFKNIRVGISRRRSTIPASKSGICQRGERARIKGTVGLDMGI